jgi:hypothetical protein
MWSNTVREALLVADASVALTALGGGIALATGLEAKRFPVEWQRGTPFSSHLIPA